MCVTVCALGGEVIDRSPGFLCGGFNGDDTETLIAQATWQVKRFVQTITRKSVKIFMERLGNL